MDTTELDSLTAASDAHERRGAELGREFEALREETAREEAAMAREMVVVAEAEASVAVGVARKLRLEETRMALETRRAEAVKRLRVVQARRVDADARHAERTARATAALERARASVRPCSDSGSVSVIKDDDNNDDETKLQLAIRNATQALAHARSALAEAQTKENDVRARIQRMSKAADEAESIAY